MSRSIKLELAYSYRGWVVGFIVVVTVILVTSTIWFNPGGGIQPKLASVDSWLEFYGVIVGGIISGGITLIVLIVSLKKQQESIDAAYNATKIASMALSAAQRANELAQEANELLRTRESYDFQPILYFSIEAFTMFQNTSYNLYVTNIGNGPAIMISSDANTLWDITALPEFLAVKQKSPAPRITIGVEPVTINILYCDITQQNHYQQHLTVSNKFSSLHIINQTPPIMKNL